MSTSRNKFLTSLTFFLHQNVENVLNAEGTGLVTALRVLCHIACPPPPAEGKESKHNF